MEEGWGASEPWSQRLWAIYFVWAFISPFLFLFLLFFPSFLFPLWSLQLASCHQQCSASSRSEHVRS